MADITATGLLETAAGKPRVGVRVAFRVATSFSTATESYIAGTEAVTRTGAAGTFSIDIAVPDDGAAAYGVYIGESSTALLTANLSAADDPVDLADMIAGAFDAATDSVSTLLYGAIAPASVGASGQYATLALALAAGEKYIALEPATYSGAVTISGDDVKIAGYGATWTEQTAADTFTVTGARVEIEGIEFSGSHDGVEASMTSNNAVYTTGLWTRVHRCKFTNLRGYAVQASGADDLEISYCHAVNVATAASPVKYTRYCFYVPGATLRPNVHHNYIEGWSQGIGFWFGTSYGVADTNTLLNNCGHETGPARRSAIEDYGDSVQNTDNRWINNTVDGTTGQCIELAQGLKGTLVQGNVLRNAGLGYTTNAGPIVITGGDGGAGGLYSEGIRVLANHIYGVADNTVSDQVLTTGGVRDVLFEGNHFEDFLNTTATLNPGSTLTPANVRIVNNTFRDSGGGGHAIIRLSPAGCVVEGNDILSTIASTRGIFADGSNGHTVANNTVDVTSQALDLDDNNIVTGNIAESASNSTVAVIGAGNILTGNRITGDDDTTGITGVLSITGNRNQVKDNYIHRDPATATGWGAVISCDTTDNRIEGNTLESGANNDTVVLFGTNSRRNVLVGNTHIRPDNALGITDNDATVSNSKNFNHTPTTLGTW
jgi:hypothetical protein